MKIITDTPRLIIAEIDNNDVDQLFELNSNQQVMKYLPKVYNYAETKEKIDDIVDQYGKYGYCFWKLLSKDNNNFIGIAGLLNQEVCGKVETEISYRIKLQYWNYGFATEAAKACKKYGEKVLNKNRFIFIIHPENIASKHIAEKLGAVKSKTITFKGASYEMYVCYN